VPDNAPGKRQRLLILGGTAEAADLARTLADIRPDLDVVTSLAGRVDAIADRPGLLRIGGFGGGDGLADYLRVNAVDIVVDATHPFADTISAHAADACRAAGVPRLMLVRPPWRPVAGDTWQSVENAAAAAERVARTASRVFLAVGPGSLPAFASVVGVRFLVRLFEPPRTPLALPDATVVIARPPFTLASERALMTEHGIDTLVTKQSGGSTDAKLAAARALRIPVVMIARPPKPEGERVETVGEAIDWLAARG
jgi:precorrin-6A/cobalt-precorrin-6A reductase